MSLQKLMTNYADYNLWANTQFITWLSTKSDEQLNTDVPSNAVAMGNPAKIILKDDATDDYITNIYNG